MTLVCTHCSGDLIRRDTHYACAACGRVYPVRAGVLIMDDTNAVDLRVPGRLLDLHKVRDERTCYGEYIKSDVEYYARLHFADFTTFHAEMLAPFLDRSIVVDLGCGHISYINAFSDSGVGQYYGVDLDEYALRAAQKNFKRRFPLFLIKNGVLHTPVKSGCADAVISSETLEHLDDPIAHMHELGRICKKGGYLSLSTPCASMYLYPYNLVTFLMNPVRFYKKLNCHRYWHEALSWHPGLRPAVLRQWVRDAGFTVIAHKTRNGIITLRSGWSIGPCIRLSNSVFPVQEPCSIDIWD